MLKKPKSTKIGSYKEIIYMYTCTQNEVPKKMRIEKKVIRLMKFNEINVTNYKKMVSKS